MSNFKKTIVSVFFIALSLMFITMPCVIWAKDITLSELVELLVSIGAISSDKAAKAREIAKTYSETTSVFTFKNDLKQGDNNKDVLKLQQVLNSDSSTKVASSGSGSSGKESTYFGTSTKNAVIKFQKKNKLTQSGIADSETRPFLNKIVLELQINSLPENLRPKVAMKANGQTGKITVKTGSTVTISWETRNVSNCQSPSGSKSTSGSQFLTVTKAGSYYLTCQSTSYGPITGYVDVAIGLKTSNTPANSTNTYGTNNSYTYVGTTPGVTYRYVSNTTNTTNTVSNPQIVNSSGTVLNRTNLEQQINALTNDLRPEIILKINGQTGNVTLTPSSSMTITWETKNVSNCQSSSGSKPTSGSQFIATATAGSYYLTCQSSYGPITGYVTVALGVIPSNISANSTNTYGTNNSYTYVGTTPGVAYNYLSSNDTAVVSAQTSENVWNSETSLVSNNLSSTEPLIISVSPTTVSNDGNSTVTITGIGFEEGNEINFANLNSISFYHNFVNNTKITFVVPASLAAGTYSISVSNGTSVSNIKDLVVVVPTSTSASTSTPSTTTPTTISTTTNYLNLLTGNGFVHSPNSPSLKIDNKLTIEAWINPSEWKGGVEVIAAKGILGSNRYVDYGFYVADGLLGFANTKTAIVTNRPVIKLNETTHVAAVVDESSVNGVSLYVNGKRIDDTKIVGDCGNAVRVATSTATTTVKIIMGLATSTEGMIPAVSTTTVTTTTFSTGTTTKLTNGVFRKSSLLTPSDYSLFIGSLYNMEASTSASGGIEHGFFGIIDDVRIFNIALTAAQIKSSAIELSTTTLSTTASPVSNLSSLVGWWNFDKGDASDSSQYKNDGNLYMGATIDLDKVMVMPNVPKSTSTNPTYVQSPVNQCTDTTIYDLMSTTTATSTEEGTPTELECDQEIKVQFNGVVEAIGQCADDGRWSIIIKPYQSSNGTKLPVVATIPERSNPNGCQDPGGYSEGMTYGAGDSSKRINVFTKGTSAGVAVGDCVMGEADGNTDAACRETVPPMICEGISNGRVFDGLNSSSGIVAGGVIQDIGRGECGNSGTSGDSTIPSGGGGNNEIFDSQTIKWGVTGCMWGPVGCGAGAVIGIGSDFGFW